jgi:hypothetical protein
MDLEGSSRGVIEVLSRHLLGGIEENGENLRQNIRCRAQDLYRAPPENKSGVLPLGPACLVTNGQDMCLKRL